MPSVVADIFRQAACLNAEDPRIEGSVLRLEDGCDVIVAGDLHGHRGNLAKLIDYAGLAAAQHRRLVLQEIIHAPLDPASGQDRSAECLLRAARLKIAHPTQVLFVIANHDAAQVSGGEIMKDGRSLCEAFEAGVAYAFAEQAGEVLKAIKEYLASPPLAIRCPNGVLITHSLPAPRRMAIAGTDILRRRYKIDDMRRGQPVYEWTWGRGHTRQQLDRLADDLGAEFFLLGHQPVETGFRLVNARAAIVASDHPRGCIVRFQADEPLTAETIGRCVRPIAALGRTR